MVSPSWFRTYGIPLIAGRDLTDADRGGSTPVVIVNDAFGKRYFPGANPLDHFITLPEVMVSPSPNVPMRIVGVVADAVYASLREAPRPTMYLPIAQHAEPFFIRSLATVNLSVRARAGSPAQLTRSIAAAIDAVHTGFAAAFRPLSDQISDSLARERVLAMLAGFFGAVALLLAALGLYGTTAYAVTRRRAEIAIRAALGATPAQVVALVLARVAALVALGIVLGAVVSVWAGRLVTSLLYGVPPRDASTLIGSAAALAIVGAAAGWLPARRVSQIDPAIVLRES